MRNTFLIALLCVMASTATAQITINSDNTANATLEVQSDATNTAVADGMIPPRITKQQLMQKTVYGDSQKGAFVYVTNVAGASNSVIDKITTPGLYFFDGGQWQDAKKYQEREHSLSLSENILTSTVDGVSKQDSVVTSVNNIVSGNTLTTAVNGVESTAVNIINTNTLAVSGTTVNSAVNGITTSGVTIPNVYTLNSSLSANRTVSEGNHTIALTSTATSGSNQFRIDGNTFRVNTVANRVMLGSSNGIAKLDARSYPTSITNPGSGYLAIGTTGLTAANAGAGAVRYYTGSGGQLQYSDGNNWRGLESDVEKTLVIAEKLTTQSIEMTVDPVIVTDWEENVDNNNDFDPVEGAFTAPRTGNYLISFSYNFNSAAINGNTQVEAILYSPLGTSYFKKAILSFPSAGTSEAGATITFGVRMNAGEQYYPSVWHDTGNTKNLKVGNGFVNFSVVEL